MDRARLHAAAQRRARDVLRMVVKENFSRDMVDMLAHDMHLSMHTLSHGERTHPHRPLRRPLY